MEELQQHAPVELVQRAMMPGIEEYTGEKGEEVEEEKGYEYCPHLLFQEGEERSVFEKDSRQDKE